MHSLSRSRRTFERVLTLQVLVGAMCFGCGGREADLPVEGGDAGFTSCVQAPLTDACRREDCRSSIVTHCRVSYVGDCQCEVAPMVRECTNDSNCRPTERCSELPYDKCAGVGCQYANDTNGTKICWRK